MCFVVFLNIDERLPQRRRQQQPHRREYDEREKKRTKELDSIYIFCDTVANEKKMSVLPFIYPHEDMYSFDIWNVMNKIRQLC